MRRLNLINLNVVSPVRLSKRVLKDTTPRGEGKVLIIFDRAGMQDTRLGQSEKDYPADVARDGCEAPMAGKDRVVANSFKNKIPATLAHVFPDTVTAQMHRKQAEPGTVKK